MMTADATPDWKKTWAFYEEQLLRGRVDVEPLMRLLMWIREEGIDQEILVKTSMWDLLLVERHDLYARTNVLKISWNPRTEQMSFFHSRFREYDSEMTKAVPQEDAIETLRQFLAYKFDVYRKPAPVNTGA